MGIKGEERIKTRIGSLIECSREPNCTIRHVTQDVTDRHPFERISEKKGKRRATRVDGACVHVVWCPDRHKARIDIKRAIVTSDMP